MNKTLVIIPHYNKLVLLKECLYHLEEQTYSNFDILIVDNGSSDGSSEYIYDICKNNKRYHHILLNNNTGFAYAVNRGFEFSINAGFQFSILLNNDAYVEKDFVKELVLSIQKDNRTFAVSSMMINYHNKNLVDSFGDNYMLLGWAFQGHIGENVNEILKNDECFSACGGASIYKNGIIKEIGFFDENFFAYLEDIDLSYRAKLFGYKIRNCYTARCYHLGSATSGSKYNEFKVRTSARNSIYLIYKNMPYIQILINIFPLFLGIIIKQIFFSFKGFGLDYFFGIHEGFTKVKNINKNNFSKFGILTYIKIEFELIINTLVYLSNFLKRHL